MPKLSDIPKKLRPDRADYAFDLDAALANVVGLRVDVPDDASTAETLGTERAGSGAITEDGLVLTMNYLVMEASSIWISTGQRAVLGHIIGTDFESGFALIQPLGKLDLPGLRYGDCGALKLGDKLVLAANGGAARAVATQLVGRQEFAGYWEYLIDDAFFVAPAHPMWGGAALLDQAGALVGIGSLAIQQGEGEGRMDMNMVVPVSLRPALRPDRAGLRTLGRPARPWLGIYAVEDDEHIVVGGLADGGPADQAGVRPGDRIVAVDGAEVADLAGVWRRIWSHGPAGSPVRLRLGRERADIDVVITSAVRDKFLRAPRLH